MAIELSQEELQEIETMAGLMMPPEDIARCMGIGVADFVNELFVETSPISVAFYRGSMATEIKLRKSIIRLANQGSSPAQTLAIKLRDEFKLKNAKHNL